MNANTDQWDPFAQIHISPRPESVDGGLAYSLSEAQTSRAQRCQLATPARCRVFAWEQGDGDRSTASRC